MKRNSGWGRQVCLAMAVLLAGASTAVRAEIWVDAAAAAGGDGSAPRPFQSIGQAIKALRAPDTITIKSGTYRETLVLNLSGAKGKPLVLRAAPGERVTVSGFVPIQDWTPLAEGVFVATVSGPIKDLYVGLQPQAIARWPDMDQPMRSLAKADGAAGRFQDAGALPQEPWLKEVAGGAKSALAFLYVAKGNFYTTVPVTQLELPSGTVSFSPGLKKANMLKGEGDRYQLTNHPALIRRPGQWAFETLADNKTRVYFKPVQSADLAATQYRSLAGPLVHVVGKGGQAASHVQLEGLEICGSAGDGVIVNGANHVTVERCLVHNNTGIGLVSRRSQQITFRHNVATANLNGIGLMSTQDARVEGNEVMLNMMDGITVAGNVSGTAGTEPETERVTLRRNYIHHHMLLGHPDNVQAYRGVKQWTLEENVLLWGGQGIMTEEVNGAAIRNCVVVGTDAVAVIFGHGNSNDWTVEQSTIGLGGWGLFAFSGQDYRLSRNIFWNKPLSMIKPVTSDFNWFVASELEKEPVAIVSKPKFTRFQSLADLSKATGQESHSKRMEPPFRNAPFAQAICNADDRNTADTLFLRKGEGLESMQVGHILEINGDGIARKVTQVGGDSVTYTPPLPVRPFRSALVWNWRGATSLQLDLRPVAAEGSAEMPGSTLDIGAFQRGELTGNGKRVLPELPADLKAALPNPNNVVLPLDGA